VIELPDVDAILDDVRRDGDAALLRYAQRFGDPVPRRAGAAEFALAYRAIGPELRAALERMAARVERFARAQRESFRDVEIEIDGIRCGHRALPVARAAVYVPGGRYPLPSSLIMGAVPARVAGVRDVVVVSPSERPEVLAAAHVAGIREMHVVGGAQAIAALAFGTESIARADLIVGPGNAYVTAAKRRVFGTCGIDALAGPSEVLIVAAEDADPAPLAADLLAQAEHDVNARCALLTESGALAAAVRGEIASQLAGLRTAHTAREAFERHGGIEVVSLDRAVELANARAPEHLELHGSAATERWREFTAYGALFVGAACGEVLGDYGAGPNHVLPTGGSARFSSGLSVFTFLNVRTYLRGGEGARDVARDASTIAACEGLDGHRAAAALRYAASSAS
jgi:phosphoribosyl-ATP pyrophosphohydrolase/phosphoribosyl-AMP cyclohydrolase/histidinol dehydrogenase